MSVLDRAIDILSRVQFPEVKPVLDELRGIKLASLNKAAVAQMRVNILKNAAIPAAAAVQALEAYDEVDDALGILGLLNKEMSEVPKDD